MADISKVGIPETMIKKSKAVFLKWCEDLGFTGDCEGRYNELRKEAGLEVEKKTKKKVTDE